MTMKPERLQRSDEILQGALELHAEDRAAFLDEACAGDEVLRQKVESLLAAAQQMDGFMEERMSRVAGELMIDEQVSATAGQIIGYYKIVGPLDKGGMGEVYLATDTRSGREVALKLLPALSIGDQQRVRRFQQEARSILALNHPNIVTIYEIGQTDSAHYIVTERITGETLRQRLARAPLEIPEALAIAIEVAKALEATHAAEIVHRDIKPENIMLRPDGYVKVLDFGIAKLRERQASMISSDAPTMLKIRTTPGVVMGTVYYMSPEQARGQEVDARTDIWSLGAVLYEMVAGRPPFEGNTPQNVIILIAGKEPAPLARFAPDTPPELQRIVSKALTKDREERYQTAKDLLIDLKKLKQRLDVEAEIERTVPPELRTSASEAKTASSTTGEAIHHVSSAEYIVSEIKRHKKGSALIAAVVFALSLATAGYFIYARRTPALTDKDTILLADFVNSTGDAVFDGTLKQGLAVQLGQSPFLDIFSDDRVSDALKLMGRAQNERVTREVGREICQRQGLKAMLAGSIASLGSNYVMTLEVINAQTGDVIAREQTEAQGKEQVLRSLGEASSRLREKLGESLASIQKFDAPLEQVTTSSLEALKAFSLAKEKAYFEGKTNEAIPLYKRAVELDPNFAAAYSELTVVYRLNIKPGLAAESAKKAFELRERVGER